jgi:hypothetical protein
MPVDNLREVGGACHAVAKNAPNPGIGPSFYEVAGDPGTTELSLRAFSRLRTPPVPNLTLTPHETDDIIAHILTLNGE